jgi:hypothetical protein
MLPDDIVEQLYAIAGAKWSPKNGIAAILCSARSMTGSFTFGFAGPNGPKIEVPISQLILPLVLNGTAVPATVGFPDAPADEQLCQLAISPRSALGRGPIQALLGDAFLRSAYVVFDLANERIGMAQTVFNTSDSNIVPFASSGAPIPSATTVSEVPLTYAFTGTASAYTTQPVFTQTAPFFAGSAGLAFATEVASIEGLVATATQGTGNPTTTGTSSAGSSQLFFCNQFILMEVVVGLFALGFVVIM